MDSILQQITEWLKEMLVSAIMENLSGMFESVNNQVGEIATSVGKTPASFSPEVFAMVRNISESVIIPIAGLILTFIACYELIQMIIDHNNLSNFETWVFFRWVFKTFVAVMLITNTFNITMAVFDVAQHVVNASAGIISGDTAIDASALEAMEDTLMAMDPGTFIGTVFAVLYCSGHNGGIGNHYFYHRLWKNDRNLFGGQSCTNSLFHLRKPGTEQYWTKLSAFSVCPWFSGFPDYDLCGHLCSADSVGGIF